MRYHALSFMVLLACLCSFVGLSTSELPAAEKEVFNELVSPDEIQEFRLQYINDFNRTGLNTTIGDARFLRIIIESANLKRGIEVGTATGFGAINMGMAFERNGGELVTIDISHKMVVAAREHIKNMGLEKTVKVLEGDALKVIPELEGKFDFIFLDAQKQDYFEYFKAALPMLKSGSVIVADNVIQYDDPMRDFLDFMEKDPNYDMQIIRASEEKDDGMAIIYKLK